MANRQARRAAQAAAQSPAVESPAVDQTIESPAVESPVESQPAVESPASPAKAGRLRLPLPAAKAHNLGHTVLQAGAVVVAANVALTSKGTNPNRVRVYGYDNLGNGGRVPKESQVALVPGQQGVPKGVNEKQWDKLVGMCASPVTVSHLYDNGIVSRTVRRAYRAGAIRFVGAAPVVEAAE